MGLLEAVKECQKSFHLARIQRDKVKAECHLLHGYYPFLLTVRTKVPALYRIVNVTERVISSTTMHHFIAMRQALFLCTERYIDVI